jgi:CBS domain-containing protein
VLRKTPVKYLLEQKGRNVWTIDPHATVLDAVAKMAEKDIGSLVLMDGEKLIGIITEGHYSRNIILKGETSAKTLVRDIMERNVIHVRPEQSVESCMALMTDKRVRHLPALEGTKVIGLISIGDLRIGVFPGRPRDSPLWFDGRRFDRSDPHSCSARS